MNIGLIPIRCGSKSIPLKNIKSINGQPLIYWSLKAMQDAKTIDIIYVALDCQEFANVVSGFGFEKVHIFYRSADNAQDTSSTESVILEFLDHYSVDIDKQDYLVLVQATSPMIRSEDIDRAFEVLLEQKADSLLSCVRTKRFFWSDDGESLNYNYQKRPRRQDYKGLFMENGALYINQVENVLQIQNRLSGKIAIYEMPEYTSVEIDEEDDWSLVEKLMKKYNFKAS